MTMQTTGKYETSGNHAARPIRRGIKGPLGTSTGLLLADLVPMINKLLAFGTVLLTAAASQLSATELRAAGSGTNLVLSWSQDSTNDFYLQISTNLSDSAGWRVATNPPSLVGNEYTTTAAMTGPQGFYRLKAWEILFNGSSTAAFRGYQQTSFPSNDWVVTANGELKTVAGSPEGYIITTNQYDDFELLWEWKTGPGGNSGVMYRDTEFYDAPWKSGPEYQILDDAYYSLPAEQTSGAVWGLIAPTNKILMPTGQWNQSRLLVQSNHVEHWLNDRKVVEYELNSSSFNALVGSSSYFNSYAQFAKARAGHLAFQLLTPEVWFRNIKVRQLASE